VPQPVMKLQGSIKSCTDQQRPLESVKSCSDVWRPIYTQDSFDVLVNAMAQVLQLGRFNYSTVISH